MRLKTWFWILLIFIIIGAILWFFVIKGSIGGFSVNDNFPGMTYAGSFYDIARGDNFLKNYDVFVDGKSLNIYFSSALDVCQTIYPGSKEVYESSITEDRFNFTSSDGKTRTDNGYENFCYS